LKNWNARATVENSFTRNRTRNNEPDIKPRDDDDAGETTTMRAFLGHG